MLKNPPNLSVLPNERLQILDSLRGLAVFGILFVNITAFSLPNHELNLMNFNSSAWYDVFAVWLNTHFFEGKFYILFSFLFGIGFSVQLESAMKKNVNLWSFYPKRLFILFLIGLVHSYFWWGDVLRLYAILGFLLLLLKDWSVKALLILSALCLGLAGVIGLFPDIFVEVNSSQSNSIVLSLLLALSQMAPTAFALFLLGRVAGKLRFFNELNNKKILILKIMVIAILIFISLKWLLWAVITPYSPLETLPKTLSDMAMTSIYIGIFCLLSVNNKTAYYLKSLANVGKMALTNYIMQTVICVLFFKLTGLTNQLQMGVLLLLSVVIFMAQMIYSHYWLKYCNYGLLEWVWRSLTYGKKQPLLKSSF